MNETDVFICYSRADNESKQHVKRFLAAMQRAKEFGFSFWDDSQINPGEAWERKLTTALSEATAGLLLVSADFLASDFIQDREVPYTYCISDVIYCLLIIYW